MRFASVVVATSLVLLVSISLAACGEDDAPTDEPAGTGVIQIPTGGICGVAVADQAVLPSPHLLECSYIPYDQSNPPSSGPHYPRWAAFKTYATAVPRGYLVHDLEHGGIVISYNCPAAEGGCADEVAKAQGVIDAFVDPTCASGASGSKKRVTMSPDPKLDTPFAVAAWGHTLRATCVDEASFGAFMRAYFDRGPESFCTEGVDLATEIPAPSCGEPSPPTP